MPMTSATFALLSDALATVPAAERINLGHQIISRAVGAAAASNSYAVRQSWPDGSPLRVYDWREMLEAECWKVRHAHKGPRVWADPNTRDGLNAIEAAVLVLTDAARAEEVGCAA